MDAAVKERNTGPLKQHALLIAAFAPLLPQIAGSIFNTWYNMVIIDPLLRTTGLVDRFVDTAIFWNAVAYPIALAIWLWLILSLRQALNHLRRREPFPPERLDTLRRGVGGFPWVGARL